jgi:predicted nucleic acid-binding protein
MLAYGRPGQKDAECGVLLVPAATRSSVWRSGVVWQFAHGCKTLAIVLFDKKVIWAYGNIRTNLEKRGTPIGEMDRMIAVPASSLNLRLVTNNVCEFEPVKGLRLEKVARAQPTLNLQPTR